MPQLDIANFLSQLFWLAISFAGLYFSLSRLALPKIKIVIEDRKSIIVANIKAAEGAKRQAELIEYDNNVIIKKAKSNANKFIIEAEAKIKKNNKKQLQLAHQSTNKIKDDFNIKFQKQVRQFKKQLLDLKPVMIDELNKKIYENKFNEQSLQQLINKIPSDD